MNLHSLIGDARVVGIVDNQFGDTGKGKVVDLFATEWADVIIRGTGGANSGHTTYFKGQPFFFHLLPSGTPYDADGKVNVVGRGVAFDPAQAVRELDLLAARGVVVQHLKISHMAKLVLPFHVVLDRLKDRGEGIGTTGRGIGPTYVDHCARIGLIVNDLLNPDVLARKLRRNLEDKVSRLQHFGPEAVQEVLVKLGWSHYHHPRKYFDCDAVVAAYSALSERLKQFICDTDSVVQRALTQKKRILLEGAQGLLLSIDHGTYPYVTSSDCSIRGLAHGAGLRLRDVDATFGVTKAFYMTRVGAGPFPTEFGGAQSVAWCANPSTTKDREIEVYGRVLVNHPDPFHQGIGIRQAGNEYGTTTGRPRSTGWLDLPLLCYAQTLNGPRLILTKLDVLDECETIKICDSYEYVGPPHRSGALQLHSGAILREAVVDQDVLQHCRPIYAEFPGWLTKTSDCTSFVDLPEKLQALIRFVEQQTASEIAAVSVGPGPSQFIVQEKP